MSRLVEEAGEFRAKAARSAAEAAQRVAFRLAAGLDLEAGLQAQGEERAALVMRLRRLLERERLKGARRHWGYDLNRHIALKQALDRIDPPARSIDAAPGRSRKWKRRPEAPHRVVGGGAV